MEVIDRWPASVSGSEAYRVQELYHVTCWSESEELSLDHSAASPCSGDALFVAPFTRGAAARDRVRTPSSCFLIVVAIAGIPSFGPGNHPRPWCAALVLPMGSSCGKSLAGCGRPRRKAPVSPTVRKSCLQWPGSSRLCRGISQRAPGEAQRVPMLTVVFLPNRQGALHARPAARCRDWQARPCRAASERYCRGTTRHAGDRRCGQLLPASTHWTARVWT